jgi:ParB family chromosome partitioning protein
MTHEKAADAVGRSRAAVSNLLRLLNLSAPVHDLLMHNKIDMGHARALIGLDEVSQLKFAERVVANGLSVREVENLVKKHHEQEKIAHKNIKSEPSPSLTLSADLLKMQEVAVAKLGASISIKTDDRGAGELKINYGNLEQLYAILSKITR